MHTLDICQLISWPGLPLPLHLPAAFRSLGVSLICMRQRPPNDKMEICSHIAHGVAIGTPPMQRSLPALTLSFSVVSHVSSCCRFNVSSVLFARVTYFDFICPLTRQQEHQQQTSLRTVLPILLWISSRAYRGSRSRSRVESGVWMCVTLPTCFYV